VLAAPPTPTPFFLEGAGVKWEKKRVNTDVSMSY
jgi:hypothetical protein